MFRLCLSSSSSLTMFIGIIPPFFQCFHVIMVLPRRFVITATQPEKLIMGAFHDPAVIEINYLIGISTADILWAMTKQVNPSCAPWPLYGVLGLHVQCRGRVVQYQHLCVSDRARAIDILCFCPPDSPTPLSPITVWYRASGHELIDMASRQAALNVSSETSPAPNFMFTRWYPKRGKCPA